MKRCYVCKQLYEDNLQECPCCGYSYSAKTRKPQYLTPGVMLNSRYTVGTVLGSGGFGITYKAWDNMLEQKVAIKEYLPGEFSTRAGGETQVSVYGGEKTEQFEIGCEKFHEESKRLAKLSEIEGIVRIYDTFRENGTAYIVMECLEGETLSERLKREEKISEDETIRIMVPILKALEECHKQNIIHRDIAPNNIYICNDGKIKLLDFGASRSATGTHSKSLTVLFKEGYTAREQYESHGNQGPWTDVYSCAATMYRALTGKVPQSAMDRQVKDTLKKPSKAGGKVTKRTDISIMNALNLGVEKRTKSAEELLEELTGRKRISKRYEKTKEKVTGRVPAPIYISGSFVIGVVAVFIVLMRVGVIKADIPSMSKLLVPEGKVRVANIVNKKEEEARKVVEKAGLVFEIGEVRYSNKINAGRVISQSEKKGTIVDKGTVLEAVISKGAGIVKIPEMTGRDIEEVKSELDELCIEYEIVDEKSRKYPGTVIYQSTETGTEVEQGSSVVLRVSTGNSYDENRESEVVSFVGMQEKEAEEAAEELGIYLKTSEYVYDDEIARGEIIRQNVKEKTVIKCGSLVEIVVSKGIEQFEVPDVVGKSEEEAKELLESQNFKVDKVIKINEEEAEGTVLDQSEKAGEYLDKYSEITIRVATKVQVGDSLFFGHYEQDSKEENGDEDIEWRVLAVEEDSVLLISKLGLDCQPYNTTWTDVTWETCTLRKWLNETFMDTAFSNVESEIIKTTTVIAENSLWFPNNSTVAGNNTQDKIFILSISEVNKYFESETDSACEYTEAIDSIGAKWNKKYGGFWWLRNPGEKNSDASMVMPISLARGANELVHRRNIAVRPSLWLYINK